MLPPIFSVENKVGLLPWDLTKIYKNQISLSRPKSAFLSNLLCCCSSQGSLTCLVVVGNKSTHSVQQISPQPNPIFQYSKKPLSLGLLERHLSYQNFLKAECNIIFYSNVNTKYLILIMSLNLKGIWKCVSGFFEDDYLWKVGIKVGICKCTLPS